MSDRLQSMGKKRSREEAEESPHDAGDAIVAAGTAERKRLKRERKEQRREKRARKEKKRQRKAAAAAAVAAVATTAATKETQDKKLGVVAEERPAVAMMDAARPVTPANKGPLAATLAATHVHGASTPLHARRSKMERCIHKFCHKSGCTMEELAQLLTETRFDRTDFFKFAKPYFASCTNLEVKQLVLMIVPRCDAKRKSKKTAESGQAETDASGNTFQAVKNQVAAARKHAKVQAAARQSAVGRERSSHDTPIERIFRTYSVSESAMAMEERWREHALTNPTYAVGRLSKEEEETMQQAVRSYCEERDITEDAFCELIWDVSGDMPKAEKVQLNAEFIHLFPNRKPKNVYMYLRRRYSVFEKRSTFTAEEDAQLLALKEELGNNWKEIGLRMGRLNSDVFVHYRNALAPPTERHAHRPWDAQDDAKLRAAVGHQKVVDWHAVAATVSSRSAAQCQARFRRLTHTGLPRSLREQDTADLIDEDHLFEMIEQTAFAKAYKVGLGDVEQMLQLVQRCKPMPATLSEAIKVPEIEVYNKVFALKDIIQRFNSVLPEAGLSFARKVEVSLKWIAMQPKETRKASIIADDPDDSDDMHDV